MAGPRATLDVLDRRRSSVPAFLNTCSSATSLRATSCRVSLPPSRRTAAFRPPSMRSFLRKYLGSKKRAPGKIKGESKALGPNFGGLVLGCIETNFLRTNRHFSEFLESYNIVLMPF